MRDRLQLSSKNDLALRSYNTQQLYHFPERLHIILSFAKTKTNIVLRSTMKYKFLNICHLSVCQVALQRTSIIRQSHQNWLISLRYVQIEDVNHVQDL